MSGGSFGRVVAPTTAPALPLDIKYTADSGARSLAATKSLTLMVNPDSASAVKISLDGGATWPSEAIAGQTKTWGDNVAVDCSAMRFKPAGSTATYSLHGA